MARTNSDGPFLRLEAGHPAFAEAEARRHPVLEDEVWGVSCASDDREIPPAAILGYAATAAEAEAVLRAYLAPRDGPQPDMHLVGVERQDIEAGDSDAGGRWAARDLPVWCGRYRFDDGA